jgi:hypothetical protein
VHARYAGRWEKTSMKHPWFLLSAAWLLGCGADADSASGRGRTGPMQSVGSSSGTEAPPAAGASGFGNTDQPVVPNDDTLVPPVRMDECAAVSRTAENRLQPADIIIGVDTSGSMDEEIAFVQQNLNAFSQQIIDSGIDVRVILVAAEQPPPAMPGIFGFIDDDDDYGVCIAAPLGSGMCPADSNPPVYTHVNTEVGSNDVLSVLVSAYPSYKAQLRPDSLKTFVSVTDDDANDPPINTAQGFITAVQALEPTDPTMFSDWRYSSIYCFTACEQAAQVGAVHRDLVAQTQGIEGDLCLQDFKPVFDALAQQVLEGVMLECDWEIPPPSSGEVFDAMKTNVQLLLDGAPHMLGKAAEAAACADREGWHYDNEAAPARVVACPATCARIQAAKSAQVDILFGCETAPLE